MYKVLDVSRYMINQSNFKKYGISNLKLQKLLYFVQACFLGVSKDKEPCFMEAIEAWDFGPVVPVAYHEYKQYGSTNIPIIRDYLDFNDADPWSSVLKEYSDDFIKLEDKKIIDEVIDKFAYYTATDLVYITHRQAPWKDAYVKNQNNIITIDSLRKYFCG